MTFVDCRLHLGQNSGQVSLNLSRGRLNNSAHVSLFTGNPLKVVMPILYMQLLVETEVCNLQMSYTGEREYDEISGRQCLQ